LPLPSAADKIEALRTGLAERNAQTNAEQRKTVAKAAAEPDKRLTRARTERDAAHQDVNGRYNIEEHNGSRSTDHTAAHDWRARAWGGVFTAKQEE